MNFLDETGLQYFYTKLKQQFPSKINALTPTNDEITLTADDILTDNNNSIQDQFDKIDEDSAYVTPQMYGAIGDGITDDTVAIQAAFNNNKNRDIFIPAGTYKITSKLVLPRTSKVSVYFKNSTIIAAASMEAVIEVDDTDTNNTKICQTITGDGLIDCNSLAECGIKLHNNAAYFHISEIQIRNVKNIGILVGDDTTRSLGVTINDVMVVGKSNDRSAIGIKMVCNDCMLNNILVFRCGIGIECNGCSIDYAHVWAEQDSAAHYAETIGINILSNYCRFSHLYLDAVGTGLSLSTTANVTISDLLYMTDYTSEAQTLYMIKAHPQCNVNVSNWSVVPRSNTKYIPLQYDNLSYYQHATRNFKGIASTSPTADIDPRNELCNIARNGYFNSLTKYFGPYNANTNYLIGYIRQANNVVVALDLTIYSYSCKLEITPGTTPVLRSSAKRGTASLNGSLLLGPAEIGPCGDNYYPVYLKTSAALSTYTFITFDCHGDCGNSGFYPLTKENSTDVVTVASVSPALTITLP